MNHSPTQTVAQADPVTFYGTSLTSRLMMGTALFPSPAIMQSALAASGAEIVTVSLRRETSGGVSSAGGDGSRFFDMIKGLGARVLPNTAGCLTAREAVTTAHMAREVFDTNWVKLEVIANNDTLQPDVFGLVEAAEALCNDGFAVFPYTTSDLSVAERLVEVGCQVLMPWGAPIGTGRGLTNVGELTTLRRYFPDTPLVVDAGIGAPSHASHAMELGYDAVLLNTAVAKAREPVFMAQAFGEAVAAGRRAYLAGLMGERDMASPSTPVAGTPFVFDVD